MTLIIISIAAFIIWRWYRKVNPHVDDGLGRVLGRAEHWDECPVCGEKDSQSPRGRGEVIVRASHYLVRQYAVCESCNARALWHRRLDQWTWTVNRSGVSGLPYHTHG